jgi:hypothetical protein
VRPLPPLPPLFSADPLLLQSLMLDRIPPELTEKIIGDSTLDKRDWAACCAVSKVLLPIARAELYRSVVLKAAPLFQFVGGNCIDKGMRYRTIPSLEVLKNPEVGSFVKTVEVEEDWVDEDDEEVGIALEGLIGACPNVVNLHGKRQLPFSILEAFPPRLQTVSGISLTPKSIAQLAQHSQLVDLSSTYSLLDDFVLSSPPPFPSLSRLSVVGAPLSATLFDVLLHSSSSTLRSLRLPIFPASYLSLVAFTALNTLFLDVLDTFNDLSPSDTVHSLVAVICSAPCVKALTIRVRPEFPWLDYLLPFSSSSSTFAQCLPSTLKKYTIKTGVDVDYKIVLSPAKPFSVVRIEANREAVKDWRVHLQKVHYLFALFVFVKR